MYFLLRPRVQEEEPEKIGDMTFLQAEKLGEDVRRTDQRKSTAQHSIQTVDSLRKL
ncbi:hypothetical protein [Methylocaldum sp. 14B]|uniref:hypothetical protein n=1 Tax=unclassified Methylocaldum TaxID=2622260 RepID=UPI00143AFFFC|nr:hypothetical protein [Methylocaldum sp. 14B]